MDSDTIYSGELPAPPEIDLSVKDVFKGNDVFVTGGTGFMGKVLIEKLLWSCDDIGNIYLMIRPKKGFDERQRLDVILKTPVFDRIRNKNPEKLLKLITVYGDCHEENLGISDKDRKMLENNVSIIFHVASSVRFNDPLKKAILLNVRGTRDVVNLATKMPNLKAMIYVSTAFSNTTNTRIEEKFCKSYLNWRTYISIAETIDENILDILTAKILGKQPNTYTFTKHLAENVVYEHSKKIPTLIFRPSVVTTTIKTPVEGWIENLNGPIGIGIGVISGLMHSVYMNPDGYGDYIPCDYAINGLIVCSWYRCVRKSDECFIFNAASGNKMKISHIKIVNSVIDAIEKSPPQRVLGYPFVMITQSHTLYCLGVYLTHLLPALFIDPILKMMGIKISIFRLYRNIFVSNEALSYFLSYHWTIQTQKYDKLESYLNDSDKVEFLYDISSMDVLKASAIGVKGIRKYILKEDESDGAIARARTTYERMKLVSWIFKRAFVVSTGYVTLNFILNYYNNNCALYNLC